MDFTWYVEVGTVGVAGGQDVEIVGKLGDDVIARIIGTSECRVIKGCTLAEDFSMKLPEKCPAEVIFGTPCGDPNHA